MAVQPTGKATLLFTDIEGSTRLLERLGTERYGEALELHRELLREAFERHGGYEVDNEGDAFFVAFASALEAVAAAERAQRALATADWPDEGAIRVRIGLHTGAPVPAPPKYIGIDVHKAARLSRNALQLLFGRAGPAGTGEGGTGLADIYVTTRDNGGD